MVNEGNKMKPQIIMIKTTMFKRMNFIIPKSAKIQEKSLC